MKKKNKTNAFSFLQNKHMSRHFLKNIQVCVYMNEVLIFLVTKRENNYEEAGMY